jgi:hypothetical protein
MNLSEYESLLVNQIKFVDIVLEEMRRRSSIFLNDSDMRYAKIIGISTPYEESINNIRKTKSELDSCLCVVRKEMMAGFRRKSSDDFRAKQHEPSKEDFR